MGNNEAIQWTITGIIVLAALLWAFFRLTRSGKKKNSCDCGSCASSHSCKAKEIIDAQKRGNCHDGKSARN